MNSPAKLHSSWRGRLAHVCPAWARRPRHNSANHFPAIAAALLGAAQHAGQLPLSLSPLLDARITSFTSGPIAPSGLKVNSIASDGLPSLIVTFFSWLPSFSCQATSV